MTTLDPRTVAWTDPAWLPDGPVYRRKYITLHPADGRLVSWTAMVEQRHVAGHTWYCFSLRQNHTSNVLYDSAVEAQDACERMIEAAAATAPACTP
jgi:hypothetical protein